MNWILLTLFWAAFVSGACHQPNIAHPLPDYDPHDDILRKAFARINTALITTVAAPEFAANSFSVEITSSKQSLWSKHHTARERNTSRHDIPEVNGDALYRIASITKSFTVLALLYQHAAGNLSLDDTVDMYLDELREPQKGSIPWKDITLRSLASQLSGIPREFAQADLINRPFDFPFSPEELGFPPNVSREGLPTCDEYGDNYDPPCTRADLMASLKSKAPLFAPNQQSTYSNIAFELLGMVIANVTGQTYDSYIEDAIFKPLNMSKSSLSQPPDSAGVIPFEPQYWDVDEGIQSPTGGIYSSSTDLSKYLRYVLTHYNAITHALNWLHPASAAFGLKSFYGIPWEIYIADNILTNSSRPVRFITKSGGLPGYTSIIMTLPEYDLGITILLAGGFKIFETLREIVTVEMVRAAEELAIKQLQQRYAGTYVSTDNGQNSSLTVIADHRGLVVEEFIANGVDIFKSPLPMLGGISGHYPWYSQLIPTLLFRNESRKEGEQWRMLLYEERSDDQSVWGDFCITNIDLASYAGEPINEFVFWKGEGDVVSTVESPAFRLKLVRKVEDSSVPLPNHVQDILEL